MMRTVGCAGMASTTHTNTDRWDCGRLCLASSLCHLFIYDNSLGSCHLCGGVCDSSANIYHQDTYTKSKK